jgi:hypothetical protein
MGRRARVETADEKADRIARQRVKRLSRETAAERVRVGGVAAETLATRERAAKTGKGWAIWNARGEGVARVRPSVPNVIVSLYGHDLLDIEHVKAADRYIADYLFGACGPGMTQKWERGVDGGGRGDLSEQRMDARAEWESADRILGATRAVVFGVLLGGVDLAAADGPGLRYAALPAKRAGNQAVLYLGLDALARHYGMKRAD